MMNVAKATSAMQRRLRPGRKIVLRRPSWTPGHQPCPATSECLAWRSREDTKKSEARSNKVPAPKKPATRPIRLAEAAASKRRPARTHATEAIDEDLCRE